MFTDLRKAPVLRAVPSVLSYSPVGRGIILNVFYRDLIGIENKTKSHDRSSSGNAIKKEVKSGTF